MADIKRAVKWMQEGRRVRRSSWIPAWHIYINECHLCADKHQVTRSETGEIVTIQPESLLADDWEIAPQGKKKAGSK